MKFSKLFHEAQFHGANRLAEKRHRLWWCLVLAILLWCSISVLFETIYRYLENPTYTSRFYRFHHHVRFPMVTICPEINYSEHRINRFMEVCLMPPELNKTYIKSILNKLSAFYAPDVKVRDIEDLEMLERLIAFNKLDVETAGFILTTPCEEAILRCSMQKKTLDCTKLFHLELTRYGYCCVFNGKSMRRERSRWIPEAPVTVQEVGPDNSLTLVLNQSQRMDGDDLSYKWLVVQDEQYFADTLFNGTALSRGWETWAGYTQITMQMSEETRSLNPSLRKCRLPSETLKYFPVYNKIHCLFECEMAHVIERCGCLAVTYPLVPKIPVCKARDLECVKMAAVPADAKDCACQQACEQDFGFVTLVSFELKNTMCSTEEIYKGIDFNKTSIVRVYSAQHSKIVLERKTIYGLYDLYSQLGGIFNAFFGCSFLTVLELLQLIRYGIRSIFIKTSRAHLKKKAATKRNRTKVFAHLATIPELPEKTPGRQKTATLSSKKT